ncbi:MAG: RsmB/NOP family class I SAM-dependent RNA methyltransferase [Candidatus Thermoplasmatota archaeon]|nr:RsmB/NOP family class I SAM-dependent RNA methyltransferase [Candidatus Thermoplasmatota archaeon]MBU1940275.1 RsmB/NOP family class I SAM-dependent RNA methyltransferase [Candidatus Thermoplasmatota archaeon]
MDSQTFFTQRYQEIGGSLERIVLQRCIRTNTLRISSNDLQKRLAKRGVHLQKIPFVKDGFYVSTSRFNLVSCPEYLLGLFYIQDAAAQLPVEMLNPLGVVLDAFAAPGGKTSQLACYAPVVAIEENKSRFQKLWNNLERLGVGNCIAYNMDFLEVTTGFEWILLDAPCSGNYMLEPGWVQKNSLERILERSYIQQQFMHHALSLLKKNGVLVYSTCSLEPEEDELVIQSALDTQHVHLEPLSCIGDPGVTVFQNYRFDPSMTLCRRIWPSKHQIIGFFMARLRKHA